MVILWIIILLKDKGKILHRTNPFEPPMLIFYSFAVFSWIISMFFLNHNYHIPQLLIDSVNTYGKNYLFMSMFNEGFKKFLFTITNIILIYLFATNFVNRENFRKIYFVFYIIGFVASLYGILQYFGVEIIWPKVLNPFGGRCVSTFGNPNFLSSYLILLYPLMFIDYIYGKNSTLMFIFMFAYFCALLATLTRSSWFGFFISMFFLISIISLTAKKLLFENKNKILIFVFGIIITFFIWPKSPIGENSEPFGRLLEIRQAKKVYSPLHQRLLIWLCGWDMIKENPITGKGWGLFELFYPFYQGKYLFIEKLSHRTHANNSHNEIIEVCSQTGIIGLGLYILFIISYFTYSYRLIKKETKYEKFAVIALSASVLGMLVDNMLNVTIHFCIPAFLYFMNIASTAALDENRVIKKIQLSKWIKYFFILVGILIFIRLWSNFLGEINYFKGFKYSKRNNLEEALYYLSKANKFQKYEVNNNYELANTYARLKRSKEAIYYYYEALASNCGYDEIHFNLATVYSQEGNLNMAKLHYTQSLYINPLSKEAYMALGSLFLSELDKNISSAVKLYEQAVKVYPAEKDFCNNLGYLYIRMGDDNKALDCYLRALKLDPNFEFAKKNYLMLADKLKVRNNVVLQYEKLFVRMLEDVKLNKLDEAEKKCYELLNIFPNDRNAKFYLANIKYSKNKLLEAENLYKEIINKDSDNINARYNLAMTYIKQKNYQLAKQELEYILSKQPENIQVKNLLMEIEQQIKF
ncbi:MAG: tetratricopeptide repeat protein [Endomicrobia bacterium]|nr:tetratricopeptide repeat protein [Endomicrobiia bacterium]